MTEIKVPDMHCEKCVERITGALNKEGVKFSVSLENKTVIVDGGSGCVDKTKRALDDLGFSAQ